MAISIDTVYQKVLALANKEQRGYITPQEFNLFADMAQMEIFEQYFYDKNQYLRTPGNNTMSSDMVDLLQEKIKIFETYTPTRVEVVNTSGWVWLSDHCPQRFADGKDEIRAGSDLYRIQRILINYKDVKTHSVAKLVDRKEESLYIRSILSTGLRSGTKLHPTYTLFSVPVDHGRYDANLSPGVIQISPSPEKWTRDENNNIVFTDKIQIFYIRKPRKPNWAYVKVQDKPFYNSTNSTHFELHASEEIELIYRILALSGISIEKPQLTQVAAGLQGSQIQQEKQ